MTKRHDAVDDNSSNWSSSVSTNCRSCDAGEMEQMGASFAFVRCAMCKVPWHRECWKKDIGLSTKEEYVFVPSPKY